MIDYDLNANASFPDLIEDNKRFADFIYPYIYYFILQGSYYSVNYFDIYPYLTLFIKNIDYEL